MVRSVQSQYRNRSATHCNWQPQTFCTMKRSAFPFLV